MKKLAEAVKRAARGRDGKKRISCGRLFRIARERDAALRALGKICDDEGIRISRCRLGCFD